MRAIQFTARDTAAVVGIAEPTPAAGEVLIRVRASGVCHTDHDILIGNYGQGAFPLVPGHEFAGEVLALGPGVAGLMEGERVVVDPNLGCGHCRHCRSGLSNLCDKLGAYGVTRNGGFAEFVAVRAEAVHPIGDFDFPTAALAEPMGCALNGLRAVGTEGVETALIFGAGPMGLLIAFALKARGIADVTLVDLSDGRLARAEACGFKALHAAGPEIAALDRSHDFVADATGSAKVAEGLIRHVATGGRMLFFSVYPQSATVTLSPFDLFRRQIRLAGSHSLAPADIPAAIAAIRSAGPSIARLVSHRVGLDEALAAITTAGGADRMKLQAVF